MTLRDFRLLTNENIHPEVIAFLRADGFDVRTAGEGALLGADDVAVLRAARADNRVVLTHDGDFGRLAMAAGEPFVGIVFLRPGHIDSSFTIAGLRTLLSADREVVPPFVLVVRRSGERITIRVRGPAPAG